MIIRQRRVRNYPAHPLASVMVLANTIFNENAGLPVGRHLLAQGIGTSASSSTFITKLAASEQYGLTQGRYRDENISLTDLGVSVVAPKNANELQEDLEKAAYTPPQFKKLRLLLKNQDLPNDNFLKGLLVRDVGVHPDLTDEYVSIYKDNIQFVKTYTSKTLLESPSFSTTNRFLEEKTPVDKHSDLTRKRPSTHSSSGFVIIHNTQDEPLANNIAAFFSSLDFVVEMIALQGENTVALSNLLNPLALILIVDETELINPRDYLNYALGLGHGLSRQKPLVLLLSEDADTNLNTPYVDEKDVVLSKDASSLKVALLLKLRKIGKLRLSF